MRTNRFFHVPGIVELADDRDERIVYSGRESVNEQRLRIRWRDAMETVERERSQRRDLERHLDALKRRLWAAEHLLNDLRTGKVSIDTIPENGEIANYLVFPDDPDEPASE